MNTVTHFLFSAVIRKPLKNVTDKNKDVPDLQSSGFLIGSIIPDALLTIITIICGLIDVSRGTFSGPDGRESSLMWILFDDWFFNNPWIIAAQQLFHSPFLVAIFILVAYLLWKRGIKGAGWFFWLSCGAMLHTLVDIPVHHDDGPLLFWPLNWDIRYISPISYWDSAHFGIPTGLYDIYLIIAFIAILLTKRFGTLWKSRLAWVAVFVMPIVLLSILQIVGFFDRFTT